MAVGVAPILIAAGIGFAMTRKKKEKIDTTVDPEQPGGSEAPEVPQILMTPRDINRALNSIKFILNMPSGERIPYSYRLKKGDQKSKIDSNYWLLVDVEEAIRRDGQPDPMGAVMVVVLNNSQKPVTAKRVIMQDKKIIDLK